MNIVNIFFFWLETPKQKYLLYEVRRKKERPLPRNGRYTRLCVGLYWTAGTVFEQPCHIYPEQPFINRTNIFCVQISNASRRTDTSLKKPTIHLHSPNRVALYFAVVTDHTTFPNSYWWRWAWCATARRRTWSARLCRSSTRTPTPTAPTPPSTSRTWYCARKTRRLMTVRVTFIPIFFIIVLIRCPTLGINHV